MDQKNPDVSLPHGLHRPQALKSLWFVLGGQKPQMQSSMAKQRSKSHQCPGSLKNVNAFLNLCAWFFLLLLFFFPTKLALSGWCWLMWYWKFLEGSDCILHWICWKIEEQKNYFDELALNVISKLTWEIKRDCYSLYQWEINAQLSERSFEVGCPLPMVTTSLSSI